MRKSMLFLSIFLMFLGSNSSRCFCEWHAWGDGPEYREGKKKRREAEERWIRRNREREREQNRRDRRTKKLLEKGIDFEEKGYDPNIALREIRERREREARNKRDQKNKPCFDLDVVSPIRNRDIYLNQCGDIIIDAQSLKGIDMGNGTVSCLFCHRKVSFKTIFNHYKHSKHRYFLKMNPPRNR